MKAMIQKTRSESDKFRITSARNENDMFGFFAAIGAWAEACAFRFRPALKVVAPSGLQCLVREITQQLMVSRKNDLPCALVSHRKILETWHYKRVGKSMGIFSRALTPKSFCPDLRPRVHK